MPNSLKIVFFVLLCIINVTILMFHPKPYEGAYTSYSSVKNYLEKENEAPHVKVDLENLYNTSTMYKTSSDRYLYIILWLSFIILFMVGISIKNSKNLDSPS